MSNDKDAAPAGEPVKRTVLPLYKTTTDFRDDLKTSTVHDMDRTWVIQMLTDIIDVTPPPTPGIDPAQVRELRDAMDKYDDENGAGGLHARKWANNLTALLDAAPQEPVVAKDVVDALEWALNNLVEPDPITDDDCLMLQGWRDRNQECWGILQRCMGATPDEPEPDMEAFTAAIDSLDDPVVPVVIAETLKAFHHGIRTAFTSIRKGKLAPYRKEGSADADNHS